MKNNYYVYRVDVDEECYYIGMGKGDRIKHCLSGKSNNYRLNEVYFRNKLLKSKVKVSCVKVKENLYKDEALKIETALIIKHRPHANTSMKNIIREEVMFQGEPLSAVLDEDVLRVFLKEKVSLLNSTTINRLEHSITDYNLKDNLPIVNKAFESSIVRTKTKSDNLCVSCCRGDEDILKGKGFRQSYNIHRVNHYENYFTGSPITLVLIPYYVTSKHKLNNLTYIPEDYSKDKINIYLFVEAVVKLLDSGSDSISILVTDKNLKNILEDYMGVS